MYVITGETGEYEDRRNWNVCVVQHLDRANEICKSLNDWCRENGVDRDVRKLSAAQRLVNPLDKNFSVDYTGTYYSVEEIEVRK